MRLTDTEVAAIKECATVVFGRDAEIRLFGSRADDRRRGGDIDLHVVAHDPERVGLENEIRFLVMLKDRIGDQKIDVIVRGPSEIPCTIDRIALDTGIPL